VHVAGLIVELNDFEGAGSIPAPLGRHQVYPVGQAIERIVSLSASTTALLEAVGFADRLVGVTRDCARLTPAVDGLPLVGDSWSATPDEVADLAPDLVVAAAPYQAAVVAGLVERRLRFLATAPWTLEDVYRDMLTLGAAVGEGERMEALVVEMKERVELVRAATAGLPKPRVDCEVWMKPVMSSPPWVSELVEAAGGQPVIEPARVLDPEDVVRANPDLVVLAWCGAIGRSNPVKFAERPGYHLLDAVQSGRVVPVRDEYLNAPCQHLLTGLDILAHALHPEVFGPLESSLQVRPVRGGVGE
jgi:iron complex transport system substrate-binding protein